MLRLTIFFLILFPLLYVESLKAEPIPQQVHKCVAFVTAEFPPDSSNEQPSIKLIGTGFFIKHTYAENPNRQYVFFITAKHVILNKEGKILNKIYLRMNDVETNHAKDFDLVNTRPWFFHPDKSVDIAVHIPTAAKPDILAIKSEDFCSEELIKNKAIGIGDDVFYIGLLPYYSGNKKIYPITRFGRLALTTDEKTGDGQHLHFLDADNMPGHSGSPVFLWATPTRQSSGIVAGPRIFALYGVVSNILEYKKALQFVLPKQTKMKAPPIPIDTRSGGVTGIVPVKYLLEILEGPEMKRYLGLNS